MAAPVGRERPDGDMFPEAHHSPLGAANACSSNASSSPVLTTWSSLPRKPTVSSRRALYEERSGYRAVKISIHLVKRRYVEKNHFVIGTLTFDGGLERAWAPGAILPTSSSSRRRRSMRATSATSSSRHRTSPRCAARPTSFATASYVHAPLPSRSPDATAIRAICNVRLTGSPRRESDSQQPSASSLQAAVDDAVRAKNAPG